MLRPTQQIDLHKLTWDEFESMCQDILIGNGLLNVTLQGKTCPAFDIICEELTNSAIKSFMLKWGVQCKLHKRNIGQNVFDNIIPEARNRNIQSVLLISASDFTDKAYQQGEVVVNNYPEILRVDFWDKKDIKKQIAKHPDLIVKYFDIELPQYLTEKKEDFRILEWISDVTGEKFEHIESLLTQADLNLLAYRLSQLPFLGGTQFPARVFFERVTSKTKDSVPQLNNKIIQNPSYDKYYQLEHYVTLSDFSEDIDSAISKKYKKITDSVICKVSMNRPKKLTFLFAKEQDKFNESHFSQCNEYTWLFKEDTLIPLVEKYTKITDLKVDNKKLNLSKKTSENSIIEFSAHGELLTNCWDKDITIQYTVETVFPKSSRKIFSSLHAPSSTFRFSLTSPTGFGVKPTVNCFFSGSPQPNIIFQPKQTPITVIIKSDTEINKGSGLVIMW